MVDKVYDDSMMGFDHSWRLANALTSRYFDALTAQVDTGGAGVPVVVYNPLGWSRTDIAEGDVAFSEPGVMSFALLDPDGQPVTTQSVSVLRNPDGGIRQTRIAFLARQVPSLGYAVYHAVPNAKVAAPTQPSLPAGQSTQLVDRGTIENEYYRAAFNLWNGDITSLVLKENGWEVLAAPANVAREYDGGDVWELYGTLNGGRFTAMRKPIGPPRPQFTQLSSDFVGGNGSTRPGPVFSEFRITHPLGKNQFSTRVRVYTGLRRIDVQTQIVNQEEFVRYRALLPTTVRNGTQVAEIPFGAIERPGGAEFPAQNWVDYGDSAKGLTLINRALPGNNLAGDVMMLSLMRSTRLIAYGFGGGFEPGVGSDSALGIGKRYTHDYALVPHAGSWRQSTPWRAGLEFNHPLMVRTAAPHAGKLPARWGAVEVSSPNVVISSLKPGRNGLVIVRLYEAAGTPAGAVRIRANTGINQLHEANLIEDPGAAVAIQDNGWSASFRPYEIKTYALRLAPRR
ncbi:MAG: glycosyl hydrolase-related protein [Acidobacteria bacterium]|nr:glycosyl hydrolase-related protein [Acidobacteriota bacterium]